MRGKHLSGLTWAQSTHVHNLYSSDFMFFLFVLCFFIGLPMSYFQLQGALGESNGNPPTRRMNCWLACSRLRTWRVCATSCRRWKGPELVVTLGFPCSLFGGLGMVWDSFTKLAVRCGKKLIQVATSVLFSYAPDRWFGRRPRRKRPPSLCRWPSRWITWKVSIIVFQPDLLEAPPLSHVLFQAESEDLFGGSWIWIQPYYKR